VQNLKFKSLDYYKNKKVLVTGNTGFKGSWLSLWLNMLNARVYGISKDIPSKPSLYSTTGLSKKIKTSFFDIKNYGKLKKKIDLIKPNIIFHLAAQSIVSKSFKKPMDTFYSNSIGTANILEYLRTTNNKIDVIIITSDKCYYPSKKGYYKENDRLGGIDPYSGSKAIAELFFENYFKSYLYKKKNISCISARAGNVIGGGDWTKDRIIPDLFKSILLKKNIILRNPKANRPWQHVLEPISAYLFLGYHLRKNKNSINGESFNIGPNIKSNATVKVLINKIIHIWGGKTKVLYNKRKKFAESNKLNLNTNKIYKKIGWKSRLNFNQTCHFICSWYLEYFKSKNRIEKFTESQIKNYINLKT